MSRQPPCPPLQLASAGFSGVARERKRRVVPLTDDALLEPGLDSLCLAIVVARLEGEFGTDPFSADHEVGIAAAFGEFVARYENVPA